MEEKKLIEIAEELSKKLFSYKPTSSETGFITSSFVDTNLSAVLMSSVLNTPKEDRIEHVSSFIKTLKCSFEIIFNSYDDEFIESICNTPKEEVLDAVRSVKKDHPECGDEFDEILHKVNKH